MKIGSLLGIDILLNPWLILLLMAAILIGYVPETIMLLSILFIHEFSHAITARALGLYVSSVELMPFGGVARVETLFEGDAKTEIAVAAAGPVLNLLIVAVIASINAYRPLPLENMRFFISCNAVLAVFNLLPGLPLDGGRILRAVLSIALGIRKATAIAIAVGKVIAAFLCVIGVYILIIGIINPTFLIMGAFMFISMKREWEKVTYIALRDSTHKKELMLHSGSMPIREIAAIPSATIQEVMRHFISNRYNVITVIDSNGRIKGYVSEAQIINALIDRGPHVVMSKLI